MHGDGDEESDIRHRLCPTYASDINSPLRHVRTRIYFTSEVRAKVWVRVLLNSLLRDQQDGNHSAIYTTRTYF